MRNVTKEIFLNTTVCPTLGWLLRSEEEVASLSEGARTLGEQFRIEQGLEVHRRARQLYPDGILVAPSNRTAMQEVTISLMNDPGVNTIFEATCVIDDYVTKADILKREGEGWHIFEVKSSVNDKEEFIDDMAYTTMVFNQSGHNITLISLVLISKDYRLGMSNEELFIEIDHTDEVLARAGEFYAVLFDYVKTITGAPTKPQPELRRDCKNCPLFGGCMGRDIKNHILEIPRLSQPKFEQLREQNVTCIEDIPEGFPLTENQSRVRACVITQQPFIGDQLADDLLGIIWPAFYLDFETVMTAIPLYPDIAPHTQLPTQYSIHVLSDISHITDHREYLADPSKDCRRDLAEHLINDLETSGSIIVYSSFEKTTITKLGQLYPYLTNKLNLLIERIVDLEAIIKKNYYHHGFHGSSSIKRTLPTLVPEMSYDDLKIAEGDSALAAFAYLAQGRYSVGNEAEAIKKNLLEYCKQDTLAMVKLHQKLYENIV